MARNKERKTKHEKYIKNERKTETTSVTDNTEYPKEESRKKKTKNKTEEE